MYRIILISGLFLVTLTTCIDPYVLNLEDYESLMVVDGLITDEPVPYTVTLSRTFSNKIDTPRTVYGAIVYVTDKDDHQHFFNEVSPGVYQTNPLSFVAETGNTYTLHITAPNGNKYESPPCLLSPSPDIDTIYYVADKEFFDNGTTEEEGVRIFLNSGPVNGDGKYFRWAFEEDWKFKVPYPVAYAFLGGASVISIPVENEVCWKEHISENLIVQSIESGQTNQIVGQPITFISTTRTDRLQVQYSILVKQYAISREEFDYWISLKQVTEEGGDIFDQQPYTVTGNIHCTNKENEKVLGYFSVSGKKEKRIYITKYDVIKLGLPLYRPSCEVIEVGPDPQGLPQSYESIYNLYTGMGYVFVYPLYNGLSLSKLGFTSKRCSDCSVTGDTQRPDFWVDLP